ncbi:MAG TPA: TonB-dependent receptor plug domain-containing protein, partial [Candidatus Kapabacteria bacterium]|nr:TonB-dependent receptor plug domain-containing protein [Candidatus Kapabacteria bacterium]
IHGIIKNGDTPITGATVRLLELDRETHSGANGEYAFDQLPSGKYHVFVRSLGYASMTETVDVSDGAAELSFSLTASAIPGEDVVVSATPYARPTNEQYQAVASKSQVEAHQSPGASVAEEIEDIPGVSVRWNGSAPARPMLRGLTDNDVLVLENGLRTGDISTFDPAHAVPVEAAEVEEVDVVRGPASVMFGPNAVGGLVNIITSLVPEASDQTVSGRASIMGNSVSDLYSGYFNTTLSNGSSALSISAGGLHSQDVKIPDGTYTDPTIVDQNGNPAPQTFHLDRIPQSFDHTSEEGIGYSCTGNFGMVGAGVKHYAMNYGIPGDPWDSTYMNPTISRIEMDKYTVELRGLFNVGGSFVDQIRFNGNITDYVHSEHPDTPATYFPSEF